MRVVHGERSMGERVYALRTLNSVVWRVAEPSGDGEKARG